MSFNNAKLMIVAMVVVAFSAIQAQPQPVPAEVASAAIHGLSKFLALIPANMMEDYGFQNQQELKIAKLGKPFQLYTMPPLRLQAYREEMTVKSLLLPTQMWYFPVTCRDEYRAILIVDRIDNQWQAVSFGHVPLSRHLSEIKRQWTDNRGYQPVLVAIFQARSYLFHLPELDNQNLTPIPLQQPRGDYTATKSLKDVISELGERIQDNLRENF